MTRFEMAYTRYGNGTALYPSNRKRDERRRNQGQICGHIWHYVGMEKLAWQRFSSSFSASSYLNQAELGNTVNTKIYPYPLIGLDIPNLWSGEHATSCHGVRTGLWRL
jgi:hypothetical protein